MEPISALSAIAKETPVEKLNEARETLIKESPLSQSLNTIESTSLETLEAQNLEGIKNSLEALNSNTLKVPYQQYAYIKDGEIKIREVPIFDDHTSVEITLPESLHIAPDKLQFTEAVKLAKEQYFQNPEKFEESLREQNKKILVNDNKILDANWSKIKYTETKMLEATESKDFLAQKKWYSELKTLTYDVVNIDTTKGKPFKILNENEMLTRQIKEITNPRAAAQGRVYCFQWHHHEKPGVLQLVTKHIHEANPHIGGNSDWGGGIRK